MSHFVVLVIGDDVDGQLAPYHEYECTGQDDEYVKDVDETEEVREEYNTKMRPMIKTPGGEQIYAHDDRFYRDPTSEELEKHGIRGKFFGSGSGGGISWTSKDWEDGKGYRGKVHYVPDGHEKAEVPIKDTMTFMEFISYWCASDEQILRPGEERNENHKYSRIEVDADGEVLRYVRRTNPNARWDWFVVGGRWTGYFPLKSGADGELGESGAFGNEAEANTADSIRKGDVDIDRARGEAEEQAIKEFEKWEAIFKEHGKPKPWSHFIGRCEDDSDQLGFEEAREVYGAQQTIKAAKKEMGTWGCPVGIFGFDRGAYVTKVRNGALVPHAIVKDGKWHEKGKMGWWAIVTAATMSDEEWADQSARLLDDLPDDTLLTAVDCHI